MNKVDFTHQLMKAVQQTDEWDRIWKEDPKLQEAKTQLDEALEQVGSQISSGLRDKLWTSIYGLNTASETVWVLSFSLCHAVTLLPHCTVLSGLVGFSLCSAWVSTPI